MEKRGFFALLVLLSMALFHLVDAANVTSNLTISNSAPLLVQDIPNQSWPSNSNLLNSFNLNSYFYDPNGDTLNFSSSTPINVTVSIASSGNVSFYPQSNFMGFNNVTFFAFDGSFNSSSNLVYLSVGLDSTPPQGNSPIKSKPTIYQNDVINFSSSWTDDFGLDAFNLSINQGSGFVNYTGDFSGTQNTSLYTIQISASAGTNVSWYFCSNDTSGNVGCMSVNNFTVQSVPASPSNPSPAASSSSSSGSSYNPYSSSSSKKITNFTVNPEFFKISLKKGQVDTRVLKITNIGNQNLSFNLSLRELYDLVVLSEANFDMPPGDSKDITIDFIASSNVLAGQYFGSINVSSYIYSIDVPIILDINNLENDFDVNVSVIQSAKSFNSGDTVPAHINIKNLKDPVQNLTLYIAIKDLYGNIYDSYQEQLFLESSLDLDRNLTLPKEMMLGDYLFYARVSSEKKIAIDSDIFQVGTGFRFASFLKISTIFFVILVLTIVTIVLFIYYRKEKEKERLFELYLMLSELKKLIEEGKTDKAIELYSRVKHAYGEPVSDSVLKNKEKLKEEITKLTSKLKNENVDLKDVLSKPPIQVSKDKSEKDIGDKSDEK